MEKKGVDTKKVLMQKTGYFLSKHFSVGSKNRPKNGCNGEKYDAQGFEPTNRGGEGGARGDVGEKVPSSGIEPTTREKCVLCRIFVNGNGYLLLCSPN